MIINKYFEKFLKSFFMAYGCLVTITAIFSFIYSTEIIKSSLLWQVILVALAYTFFKLAFVNRDELGEKVQMIFFFANLSLSEIMVILWLWFFSPGKIMNTNLMIVYILAIIIVKGLVYEIMSINDKKHAKLINEKLIEYKNGKK